MTTPILSPIPDGFKRCTKCGEIKPFEAFHRSARRGYSSDCRNCNRLRGQARRALTNPDYKPRLTQEGVPAGFKKCGMCLREKPVDAFSLHKRSKDGLQSRCNDCNRQYRRENAAAIQEHARVYRAEHQEDIREYRRRTRAQKYAKHRAWIAAHPGYCARKSKEWRNAHPSYRIEYRTRNAAVIRERQKEAYWANRDANLERSKAYHEANHDTILARKREYAKTESAREKSAYRSRRRRARIRGVDGKYTIEDIRAIRAAQTDKRGRLICWACGKPIVGNEPPPHIKNGTPMPPHLDHWIPVSRDGRNDAGNLHFMHGLCNISKGAKLPTEIGRLL